MDETTKQDEDAVRGALHTLVERASFEPVPSAPVLDRTRRGRRRRRWATGGAAVAAVLAIATGATVLADLGGGPDGSDTAVSNGRTGTDPAFTPLPGVPRGEAAIIGSGRDGVLAAAEAARRCGLRYPGGPFTVDESAPYLLRPGRIIMVRRVGERRLTECTIPGDSRPSVALAAEAEADPLPTGATGLLRNCSVQMWHDLTGWRIVARDRDPAGQAILVAVSPSGRFRATCHLATGALKAHFDGRGSGTRPTALSEAEKRWASTVDVRQTTLEHIGSQGGQTCGSQPECLGFVYYETGQVLDQVARVRFTAKDGRTHDITVGEDGWYAFAWTDGSTRVSGLNLTATAYDANGKVLWPKP